MTTRTETRTQRYHPTLYACHGVLNAYIADGTDGRPNAAYPIAVWREPVLARTTVQNSLSQEGNHLRHVQDHLCANFNPSLFRVVILQHRGCVEGKCIDMVVAKLNELRENADNLLFSVVISVSGVRERNYCETDYDDVDSACVRAGLVPDHTEPNDSEYFYLVTEDYGDEPRYVENADSALYCPSRGFIADEREQSAFWGIQDLTASGILNADDLETFSCGICYATDDETMGTLGGPLSGGMPTIVPDMVFRIESPLLIDSIRVTPFDPTWDDEHVVTDDEWNLLRDRVIARFGC